MTVKGGERHSFGFCKSECHKKVIGKRGTLAMQYKPKLYMDKTLTPFVYNGNHLT